jgi:NAD(P)-dependent dehydrogenase (short-subunit alcohol dehydrogenase family)
MLARKAGTIINVSGRGGHQPMSPSHLPGSCANAMVNLLTRGLANLYGQEGIRVTAVAPGPIRSARMDQIAAANAQVGGQAAAPSRVGTPEDVAAVVRFLASDDARHLNGTVLQVDGGATTTL